MDSLLKLIGWFFLYFVGIFVVLGWLGKAASCSRDSPSNHEHSPPYTNSEARIDNTYVNHAQKVEKQKTPPIDAAPAKHTPNYHQFNILCIEGDSSHEYACRQHLSMESRLDPYSRALILGCLDQPNQKIKSICKSNLAKVLNWSEKEGKIENGFSHINNWAVESEKTLDTSSQTTSDVRPENSSKLISRPATTYEPSTRYRDLLESIRYDNTNTDSRCRSLVSKVRQLGNDPSFETDRSVRLRWQQAFDLADRAGCTL